MRKCIYYFFYMLFVLVLCAASLEGIVGLGLVEFSYGGQAQVPAGDFYTDFEIVLDREYLYRLKSRQGWLNSAGYRDEEFRKAKQGEKRILFLGDSFVMGANVRPQETMAGVLEQISPDTEVYNMGVAGYGPDQILVRFKKSGQEFLPDTVVLSIFPPNDYSDIEKNHLLKSSHDGSLSPHRENIVTRSIAPLDSLYALQYIGYRYGIYKGRFKELFTHLFSDSFDLDLYKQPESERTREKAALMAAVLLEFKRLSEAHGFRLLVVIVPSYQAGTGNYDYFKQVGLEPEKYLFGERLTEALCDKLGIKALNLHKVFSARSDQAGLYDHKDFHLSPEGNLVAAQAMLAHLR